MTRPIQICLSDIFYHKHTIKSFLFCLQEHTRQPIVHQGCWRIAKQQALDKPCSDKSLIIKQIKEMYAVVYSKTLIYHQRISFE